jgi:hypothetical protein
MKKFLVMFLFAFIFCSNDVQSMKERKAYALLERITRQIRTSGGTYTPEWLNIKDRILENKDTLFLVTSSDFQILVRKTVSLNDIVTDTTKNADTTVKRESNTWK